MSPWESFFPSRIARKRSPIIIGDSASCSNIQRALVVLQEAFQRDFLDLGGRPPLRFFRFACNCLKYSGPRLAISLPPFRPSLTAAGSFLLANFRANSVRQPKHYVRGLRRCQRLRALNSRTGFTVSCMNSFAWGLAC